MRFEFWYSLAALNRIADLTWKHPKLVLSLVGVFALLAVAVGHNVEHHLKAAGFTDSASESEVATGELTKAFGYDPNPAIVLVVRAPGGGPLDTSSPAVRREVDRVSREVGQVKDIGHVVNPLREPRAGAPSSPATGTRWRSPPTSTPPTSRTPAVSPPKRSPRSPPRARSTSPWAASRPASTTPTTRPAPT